MEAAIAWSVRLRSGDADSRDIEAFNRWLAADGEHERAWRRIEAVESDIRGAAADGDGRAARAALEHGRAERRRRSRTLVAVAAAGLAALVGAGSGADWDRLTADHATGTGERQRITTASGARVYLNSDSAIDVIRAPEATRIRLRAGEIFVETGSAGGAAGPIVVTPHARLEPLGTRFGVRLGQRHTHLYVRAGRVRTAARDGGAQRTVDAGRGVLVDRGDVSPAPSDGLVAGAWTAGRLVARDARLDELIERLGRHRWGWLSVDPAVADLRVSGVFQLDQPDEALRSLADTLPVRVAWRTRYWARVGPATGRGAAAGED